MIATSATSQRKKERKKKLLPLNDFYFDFYFLFLTKRLGNFWENELCSVNFDEFF
jgi:hypothetical protein